MGRENSDSRLLQVDTGILSALKKLYSNSPCTHSFLYNDVFREPEYTLLYISYRGASIDGYLLLFSPVEAIVRGEVWGVAWGYAGSLAGLLPTSKKKLSLILFTGQDEIVERLRQTGFTRETKALLMERTSKPSDVNLFEKIASRVERVSPSDTVAIAELAEIYRSAGWAERATTLRAQVASRPTFLLRGEGSTPVATGYICAQAPKSWMICGVAVHEAYRGKGYARTIMGFLHGLAWISGVPRTCLFVEESNKPALSLYTSLGYQEVEESLMVYYKPR